MGSLGQAKDQRLPIITGSKGSTRHVRNTIKSTKRGLIAFRALSYTREFSDKLVSSIIFPREEPKLTVEGHSGRNHRREGR